MATDLGSATAYAAIVAAVRDLIDKHPEVDPTICAYMIMRASALEVRCLRGAARAAELGYSISDEFAGEAAGG